MPDKKSIKEKYLLSKFYKRKKLQKLLLSLNYNDGQYIDYEIYEYFEEDNTKFINEIYENLTDLEHNLIKFQKYNYKYNVHVEYNNEYKIFSKKRLIKNFRYAEKIYNHINKPNIKDNEIIDMWLNCVQTDLFPKIIKHDDEYVYIEFLNGDNYVNLDSLNNYQILLIINKNKDKLLSYYNTIKNQYLCIKDFNFNNFIVDTNTKELYMVDCTEMDCTSSFLPEIFFSEFNHGEGESEIDELNNYWVFTKIGSKDRKFYKKFIEAQHGNLNEIKNITFI